MYYEVVIKIVKLCWNTNTRTLDILSFGGMAGNGSLDAGKES
jgi:hypothetical protein